MHKYSIILIPLILIGFTSCSKHPKCEKADMFGHCKKWKGQEQGCQDSFMGFCRDREK